MAITVRHSAGRFESLNILGRMISMVAHKKTQIEELPQGLLRSKHHEAIKKPDNLGGKTYYFDFFEPYIVAPSGTRLDYISFTLNTATRNIPTKFRSEQDSPLSGTVNVAQEYILSNGFVFFARISIE
jgi:hypothetical protein